MYKDLITTSTRITILSGKSGVGKTSLVMAGLISKLLREESYTPIYCRCGDDPEKSIIKNLIKKFSIESQETGYQMVEIPAIVNKYCKSKNGIVIIIDQVEEAFFKIGKLALKSFFTAVQKLISHNLSEIRFLFVIREDYLIRLADYNEQLPGIIRTLIPLTELSRKDAKMAIMEPLKAYGIETNESLIDDILNDLSPDLILPAHLQIVCNRLYDDAKDKWSIDLYKQTGGATQILKDHLNNSMITVPHELLSEYKTILKAMVTSEETKAQLNRDQIVGITNINPEKIDIILYSLIHTYRLVREMGDFISFELTHETLAKSISEWLSVEDKKNREVQELLNQETSDAIKNPGHVFPADKLALILEYKEKLVFSQESIKIIVKLLFRPSQLLPTFWKDKLSTLDTSEIISMLYRDTKVSSIESMAQKILNDSHLYYENAHAPLSEIFKYNILKIICSNEEIFDSNNINKILNNEDFTEALFTLFSENRITNHYLISLIIQPKYWNKLKNETLCEKIAEEFTRNGELFKNNSIQIPEEILSVILNTLSGEERLLNYNNILNISINGKILGKVISIFLKKKVPIQRMFFIEMINIYLPEFKYKGFKKSYLDSVKYQRYDLDYININLIIKDIIIDHFLENGLKLIIDLLNSEEFQFCLDTLIDNSSNLIMAKIKENEIINSLLGSRNISESNLMVFDYDISTDLPSYTTINDEIRESYKDYFIESLNSKIRNYIFKKIEHYLNLSFSYYMNSIKIYNLKINIFEIIKNLKYTII